MKREYPLFLIDRSKSENYPFDFICCADAEVGFIARVVPFFQNKPLEIFVEKCSENPDFEFTSTIYKFNNREGGVILVVEKFLHNFKLKNEQKQRIKVLLKKALKKYMHAESDRTAHNDLGIDNQIKQMELNLEHNLRNYDDLVKRAESKEYADYMINLTRATISTLKRYQDLFVFKTSSRFILNEL